MRKKSTGERTISKCDEALLQYKVRTKEFLSTGILNFKNSLSPVVEV